MKVVTWTEFKRTISQKRIAATIGVFDGFHRGHQELVRAVKRESPEYIPYVITFRENPKKFLHPAMYRGSILTIEQKLSMISYLGVEHCVLIDFSDNFATLAGREFLTELYLANVRFVAVGENFQFGYKLDTDASRLKLVCGELGMRTHIVENVMYRAHPVSSSRIRHAVVEGRLAEACEMLGRPYQLAVRTESRRAEFSGETFVPENDLILPPDGEYTVIVRDGIEIKETTVSVAHRHLVFGLRMQSEKIRLAFVDKATQEKENLVWL